MMNKHSIAAVALAALAASVTFGQATQEQRKSKPEQTSPVKRAPEPPPQDAGVVLTGDETLKLGTELVNVSFNVVDRNNRVITDLGPRDVAVFEDGQPQELFTFKSEASLPINIAILIDLSGSQEYTFPQERSAAGEFLRSIIRPSKDSAAIVVFQDDVELIQGLSSRIETLNRAFEEIQYSRRYASSTSRKHATALYDAIYVTADEVLARDDYRGRPSDDSVIRRAVILLTDGVDNASSRSLGEAIERAWRAGVSVYSIGIGDRFRFEGVREDVLRRLSEETGGRAYFPLGPDELIDNFRQIESELRNQYLVAYSPSNTARDGSFRRIEVRLPNRDGLRIIHRRGYYAPMEEVKK